MNPKILITAHAGCQQTKPNSWEYLEMAAYLPCDVIEVDVREKGDTLWLAHDQLQKPSVTLKEALTFLKSYPKKINCDLKEEIFEEVAEMVETLKMEDQVIYTGTMTLTQLLKVGHRAEKIFLNIENLYNIERLEENIVAIIKDYKALHVGGINLESKRLTPLLMDAFRFNHIPVAVWTVDDEEEMTSMIQLGVQSITTHEVTKLHQLLEVEDAEE